MAKGMTCYERDETLCEDQMCLRVGCRIRNDRLSAESKMPARIWAWGGTASGWSPRKFINEIRAREYIRADIVEALAEALKEARDALNGAPNTIGLHIQIDSALTSYREASNDKA